MFRDFPFREYGHLLAVRKTRMLIDIPRRMQNCITRFRARRRIQADRILYFNEYLFLGGVDCNAAVGTGLHDHDFSDMTVEEKREALATDVIYGTSAAGTRFYNGDKETWTVDFVGVVSGFLSVTLVQLTGCEWDKMSKGVGIVENFLKYVLHHDVCPEYETDVKKALEVCELARVEWPMLQRIYQQIPGQFNLAATELFCVEDPEETWSVQQFGRLKGCDARSVFYSSLALVGNSDSMWSKILKDLPKLVREFDCTLQLLSLERPQEGVCERFKAMMIDGKNAGLIPIGKAIFAPSFIEDEWDTPKIPCPIETETIDLYFDDDVLDNLSPGMKMRATLGELDVGIHFVKSIDTIVPSFHTFLPQELMRHYKEPRPNDRPAPSVLDPDAEEKQHANAANE